MDLCAEVLNAPPWRKATAEGVVATGYVLTGFLIPVNALDAWTCRQVRWAQW